MSQGFCIDRAFGDAAAYWNENVQAMGVDPVALSLVGDAGALVPDLLAVELPGGRRDFLATWPDTLPRDLRALRRDDRVWRLFLTEWSIDEIRRYLELPPTAMPAQIRRTFTESPWWREFESMVFEACRYEWRAALDLVAPGQDIDRVIVAPERVDDGLAVFRERLGTAAATFEANHHDAQLLYGENARILGFLHLATNS